jgi:hypothetical protein
MDMADTMIDANLRSIDQDDNDDDEPHQHRNMTMEEFIRLADDEGECLNLLDLPNYQPEVPIFVR